MGNFYTKIQKVIVEAFHGDFLLKIGIIWFKDIRKTTPSKIKRLSTKGVYLSQLAVLSNLKIFFQKMSEIRYKVDVWVKEPTFISEIFQKN